jgi:hypothetical protein
MDPTLGKLIESSPGLAVALIVWFMLRDHGKILRSIDLRLGKTLENLRRQSSPGAAGGIPTQPIQDTRSRPNRAATQPGRTRSARDSDMDDGTPEIAIPRTNTDDDLESGG